MQQLGKVLTQTKWNIASDTINRNSDAIYEAILQLENTTIKHKGYFVSLTALTGRYPNAEVGSIAFVYNAENAASEPYDIYEYKNGENGENGAWHDTGLNGGSVEVDMDGMQDKIYGYTEYYNGEYTEEATISTGEENQTSHVKVDGKNHQIDMVVNKQDEDGDTTTASMKITEQGVSINGRLLVSDATNGIADISAPDQMVLRAGDFSAEDAVIPYVSINSSLNWVSIGSHNNEATILVSDGNTEVVAQEIQLRTKKTAEIDDPTGISINEELDEIYLQTKDGKVFIRMIEDVIEVWAKTHIDLGSVEIKSKALVPAAITQQEMETMQENDTWEDFLADNPNVYVYE